MLVSMRALPGRELRSPSKSSAATVTRHNAGADQRRRILRAVGELVGERGYGEVTVELVVKRAHVSFKTFYKHFSTKEDCLLALCERAFDAAEQAIRERLAAEPVAWPEQVVLVLSSLFDQIMAEPVISRAVIVESPTVSPALRERYELATRTLVPLFRAGRTFSPRGPELPERIEETLVGSVFWSLYQRLTVDEAGQLPAALPVVIELVLRTYLPRDEARRIARAESSSLEPALA
jgi:AcrR family transcriptional regulator